MLMSRIGGQSRSGPAPSAAAWGVRSLLEIVRRRGADASVVLHAAGLREAALDDPDLRIDAARAYRTWEAAVALTGEADLGLIVAGSQAAGAFDLLEYAFRASPTLGRAFEQIARYRRVARDDLEVSLAENGERVTIAFTLGEPGPLLRQQADYFLLSWLLIARGATGLDDLAPLETRVPYPAPESVEGIARAFGGPVVYDSAGASLVFARDTMALPTTRPDPALVRVLGRRLRQREPSGAEAPSFAAAVRARLEEDLPSGEVTAARVSAELGLSVRTLDRRLAAEGTSFRGVLDGVRRAQAEDHLRDPRTTPGEIAFLLGYSESSAFHRSFKRWTGLTPREFRRQASRTAERPSRRRAVERGSKGNPRTCARSAVLAFPRLGAGGRSAPRGGREKGGVECVAPPAGRSRVQLCSRSYSPCPPRATTVGRGPQPSREHGS